jgi:hypothetical protein
MQADRSITSVATRRWAIAKKEQAQRARLGRDTAVLYDADIVVMRRGH